MKNMLAFVLFMSIFVLGAWLDSEEFPAVPEGSAAALTVPHPLTLTR